MKTSYWKRSANREYRERLKYRRLMDAMELRACGQFDGIVCNDPGDIPEGYSGEVLHINDHGNVTLYRAFKNGSLHEVYGIV